MHYAAVLFRLLFSHNC